MEEEKVTPKKEKKHRFKKFLNIILKNKLLFFALALIITVAIVVLVVSNKSAKVESEFILGKIKTSSELTSAKIDFTGMSKYTDKGILFLNRSDFIMVYNATARIGIDVEDIKVDVNNINKKVYITIPHAKVLDVKVDMDSIKYFDTKFALLNIDYKNDANKATSLAEEQAKKKVEEMGVIRMADDQSESLIKGLLQNTIPKNYEVEIIKK